MQTFSMISNMSAADRSSCRSRTSFAVSYTLHLVLIALLFGQSPEFLVPHRVETAVRAKGVTRLDWLQENRASETRNRVYMPRVSSRMVPKEKTKAVRSTTSVLRKTFDKKALVPAAQPAGSPSLSGDDIRPALPFVTSDPVVIPSDLAGGIEGDVIVEADIGSDGQIVAKKVEHGLTPGIDRKVLAAIEAWRFHPAMKDGRAIASKQDIHYHFSSGDFDRMGHDESVPTGSIATLSENACPIMLIGGAARQDHISITFANIGKHPITQLDFNCGPRTSMVGETRSASSSCRENNALFFPARQYTIDCTVQDLSHDIEISVKSATFSDGYIWKPSRIASCRAVTVALAHPVQRP